MTAGFILFLMGVYMIGGGLMMLISPARLNAMIESIGEQPAVSYITGAIMAPLGAAVLVGFHAFSNWETGLVTVLGIGLLIEGWLLMAAPKTLMSVAVLFLASENLTRLMGVGVLIAGIALAWYGMPR